MQVGDPRCAEGNGGGEKKEKRRRKAGGRGMRDELVDERWRVCVGHGVLGDSDGGESVCVR